MHIWQFSVLSILFLETSSVILTEPQKVYLWRWIPFLAWQRWHDALLLTVKRKKQTINLKCQNMRPVHVIAASVPKVLQVPERLKLGNSEGRITPLPFPDTMCKNCLLFQHYVMSAILVCEVNFLVIQQLNVGSNRKLCFRLAGSTIWILKSKNITVHP